MPERLGQVGIGWVLPAFVSILVLLIVAIIAMVVVSSRRNAARARRTEIARRRLNSLGDLPGELTQGFAGGRALHDPDEITRPVPVANLLQPGVHLRRRRSVSGDG